MQKITIIIVLALMAITASSKDIKTLVVTPQPRMNCENCENKIKNALRFEKGVKEITTSLALQTVTVRYDADKTSVERLLKALASAGYTPKEGQPACGSCKADDAHSCGAIPKEGMPACGSCKADDARCCGTIPKEGQPACGSCKADDARCCGAIPKEGQPACGSCKADDARCCGAMPCDGGGKCDKGCSKPCTESEHRCLSPTRE